MVKEVGPPPETIGPLSFQAWSLDDGAGGVHTETRRHPPDPPTPANTPCPPSPPHALRTPLQTCRFIPHQPRF